MPSAPPLCWSLWSHDDPFTRAAGGVDIQGGTKDGIDSGGEGRVAGGVERDVERGAGGSPAGVEGGVEGGGIDCGVVWAPYLVAQWLVGTQWVGCFAELFG